MQIYNLDAENELTVTFWDLEIMRFLLGLILSMNFSVTAFKCDERVEDDYIGVKEMITVEYVLTYQAILVVR